MIITAENNYAGLDKWIEDNQNMFADEEKAGCVCTMQYVKHIEIK